MDKIKVNNQVVSMRKIVKQAKVHVISKLVKEVNALRTKKGTEQQVAKNKRKEERLIEEIKIIQKLAPDEVSQSALKRLKDWNSVIPDKTASLKDRSFARVAGFVALQNEVKRFLDENPKLVNLLPDFFEEWNTKKSNPLYNEAKKMKASELKFKRKQKLARLREKLSNRFELKQGFHSDLKEKQKKTKTQKKDFERVSSSQDEDKSLFQNNENLDLTEAENATLNKNVKIENEFEENKDLSVAETENTILNENIKIENEREENEDLNTNIQDSISNANRNSESANEENESDSGEEDTKKNAGFPLNSNAGKLKVKKEMSIFSLNDLKDGEILEKSENDSGDESDQQNLEQTNLKKDTFFLSADESFAEESDDDINVKVGKGRFNSSCDNMIKQKYFKRDFTQSKFSAKRTFREDSKYKNNDFHRRMPYQREKFDRSQQREGFGRKPQRFPPQFKNQPIRSKDSNWKSKPSFQKSNTKSPSSFKTNQNFQEKESNLHPSWEAKRKLKQQRLLPFQGKKITFD